MRSAREFQVGDRFPYAVIMIVELRGLIFQVGLEVEAVLHALFFFLVDE